MLLFFIFCLEDRTASNGTNNNYQVKGELPMKKYGEQMSGPNTP